MPGSQTKPKMPKHITDNRIYKAWYEVLMRNDDAPLYTTDPTHFTLVEKHPVDEWDVVTELVCALMHGADRMRRMLDAGDVVQWYKTMPDNPSKVMVSTRMLVRKGDNKAPPSVRCCEVHPAMPELQLSMLKTPMSVIFSLRKPQ